MRRLSVIPCLIAFVLLAIIAAGCGGGGSSPAAEDLVGTMVASTYQALTAAAPMTSPASATPAPPTSTPTQTAVPPTRMNIPAGSTYGQAVFQLLPGQTQEYILGAMQGQLMIVQIFSASADGILSIRGEDGTELLSGEPLEYNWWGSLPSTQDYIVSITEGGNPSTYELGVIIPARISFAPGSTGATISGRTVDGFNNTYTLWASAGQTMTVTVSGEAILEVWGFDGEWYLYNWEEATSFSMILPVTQDYMIAVHSRLSQSIEVEYTLSVDIH